MGYPYFRKPPFLVLNKNVSFQFSMRFFFAMFIGSNEGKKTYIWRAKTMDLPNQATEILISEICVLSNWNEWSCHATPEWFQDFPLGLRLVLVCQVFHRSVNGSWTNNSSCHPTPSPSVYGGFQLVMGDPQVRWTVYFMENPIDRNGWWLGIPRHDLGNLHTCQVTHMTYLYISNKLPMLDTSLASTRWCSPISQLCLLNYTPPQLLICPPVIKNEACWKIPHLV